MQREHGELKEKVVSINPVSKTVKGGRNRSFRALVVVGDEQGYVGAGLGKARDVSEAIRKATERAKKQLIAVPMRGTTIPHEINARFGAGKVFMRPAAPGTGVIAGGAVRAVLELAGYRDILTKSLGTDNPVNVVKATLAGLASLTQTVKIARLRGKNVDELLG